jgi:shikimate dehydrogenase
MPLELRRSCVIGWPVKHSRSPLIHNYWLKLYGIAGEYTAEPVARGDLAKFLDNLVRRGYVGCNVTVPLKEQAASLVCLADPLTRKLAAVNTIFIENSVLMGTNTDGFGFIAHLKASVPEFQTIGRNAMVLGAGGAARAIIAALLNAGMQKVIACNRSLDRAASLVETFGHQVEPISLVDAEASMAEIDLLVNTTSLGMQGMPKLDLSLQNLPRAAVVYDIVYVPLETDLLTRAKQLGNRTVDGLGMLLHQARPAFEKWFGIGPEVTPELRRLVAQDITASSHAK